MSIHKSKIKVLSASLLTMLVVSILSSQIQVKAEDDQTAVEEHTEYSEKAGKITTMDIDTFSNMEIVYKEPITLENPDGGFGGDGITEDTVRAIAANSKSGILAPNLSSSQTIPVYTSSTTSAAYADISGHINYSGVFPFYDSTSSRYKITIAGLEGWVDKASFKAYLPSEAKQVNHYDVVNGVLKHYISLNATSPNGGYGLINNGPAPSYLKTKTNYYSSDGHYFYTDMNVMISDYQANSRARSVNAGNPFYNYYQFINYRAPSKITTSQINSYITNKKGFTSRPKNYDAMTPSQSELYNLAPALVNYGSTFGLNHMLTLGIAINESAWGRSFLAVDRKNLFGHSAYDSYPGGANAYETAENGVHHHNTRHLNWFYMDASGDPEAWTYEGGLLGNKKTGVNVHYASDPFWGEKAAQFYYEIDSHYGNIDYNSAKTGVTNTTNINIRLHPRTYDSPVRYTLDHKNMSLYIIEEVTGEAVGGNTKWYKIASDPMVDANANRGLMQTIKPSNAHRVAPYNRDYSYFYIHSSYVDIIFDGSNNSGVSSVLGDVNNDGRVTLVDVIRVHKHYKKIESIPSDLIKNVDFNNNGVINLQTVIKVHKIYKGR